MPHSFPTCAHPPHQVRSRGEITWAFGPNRLLTGCPLGRARHAHSDRAATVRERSRSFETFDQPIFARRLSAEPRVRENDVALPLRRSEEHTSELQSLRHL